MSPETNHTNGQMNLFKGQMQLTGKGVFLVVQMQTSEALLLLCLQHTTVSHVNTSDMNAEPQTTTLLGKCIMN